MARIFLYKKENNGLYNAPAPRYFVSCGAFLSQNNCTFVCILKRKMAKAIELSDEIVNDARHYGEGNCRSAPGQIEHWVSIGRIVEENPDLPYCFIKGTSKLKAINKIYPDA